MKGVVPFWLQSTALKELGADAAAAAAAETAADGAKNPALVMERLASFYRAVGAPEKTAKVAHVVSAFFDRFGEDSAEAELNKALARQFDGRSLSNDPAKPPGKPPAEKGKQTKPRRRASLADAGRVGQLLGGPAKKKKKKARRRASVV